MASLKSFLFNSIPIPILPSSAATFGVVKLPAKGSKTKPALGVTNLTRYFINSNEVSKVLSFNDKIRYDIVDDVSMGLYLEKSKKLNGFTMIIYKNQDIDIIIDKIVNFKNKGGCHIRVQHFPKEKAQELWEKISNLNLIYT